MCPVKLSSQVCQVLVCGHSGHTASEMVSSLDQLLFLFLWLQQSS